jgi:hypothetical protein
VHLVLRRGRDQVRSWLGDNPVTLPHQRGLAVRWMWLWTSTIPGGRVPPVSSLGSVIRKLSGLLGSEENAAICSFVTPSPPVRLAPSPATRDCTPGASPLPAPGSPGNPQSRSRAFLCGTRAGGSCRIGHASEPPVLDNDRLCGSTTRSARAPTAPAQSRHVMTAGVPSRTAHPAVQPPRAARSQEAARSPMRCGAPAWQRNGSSAIDPKLW